ncbi:uncharacterized protein METZ01_LOCUS225289 [marine metagenome]|uniref:Succinylglutamate desuccinylase/Aspartoacylase catalytic domain-containing protein n=1 Tax=marine metagenome TaxID=408172 RepID=A0A382GCA9_9ZZZZ
MESRAIASYQTPSGQKVKIVKRFFSSFRKRPTKRIAFISGLHGNELEGIYLCHLLILYLKELKKNQPEAFLGEAHIYPAVNPQAIATGTRLWPFFSTDINRQFGGGNGNSLPSQCAKELLNDLKSSADIVVDFHASNLHLKEAPQIRIVDGLHKKLIPLAVQCNVDLVWVHPASPMFESTLAYNLNQSRIPTLVVETGIALRINQNFANRLFQGMLNLLRHTGVIVASNSQSKVDYPVIVHPSQVTLLKSSHAGLFVGHADLKNNITKGEIIGEVVNPSDGEVLQKVTAPENGLLFTIREHPLVYSGAPLARMAHKYIG